MSKAEKRATILQSTYAEWLAALEAGDWAAANGAVDRALGAINCPTWEYHRFDRGDGVALHPSSAGGQRVVQSINEWTYHRNQEIREYNARKRMKWIFVFLVLMGIGGCQACVEAINGEDSTASPHRDDSARVVNS